jgi:hypothetical protein
VEENRDDAIGLLPGKSIGSSLFFDGQSQKWFIQGCFGGVTAKPFTKTPLISSPSGAKLRRCNRPGKYDNGFLKTAIKPLVDVGGEIG